MSSTIWGAPELVGIGVTAGGGAYLMGSLADLPYALASVEQDFIAPENVQALIWKETVPQLLMDAVVPRWWDVSPNEMHAAALYQRAGEELLTSSAENPELRGKVIAILADRIAPGRLERIERGPRQSQNRGGHGFRNASRGYFLSGCRIRRQAILSRWPNWGQAGRELDELARKDPAACRSRAPGRDFGVPHPSMAQSDACTLLNTGLFPVSGGYDQPALRRILGVQQPLLGAPCR